MKQLNVMVLSAMLTLSSLSASAFDNKQQGGSVIGAVVGGVVGHSFGNKGIGNALATVVGAVAGSMIGSSIGSSLDNMDRMAIRDAQVSALNSQPGTVVPWYGSQYGSNSGSRGEFRVLRSGHHRNYPQEICKTYRSEIYSGNRKEIRTSTSCQRTNGGWYETNSNDVEYNNY